MPVAVALLTGERPALVQLLGIPLAVGGVVLAAAREPGGPAHASPRVLLLAAGLCAGLRRLPRAVRRRVGRQPAVGAVREPAVLVACTAAVVLGRRLPVAVPRARLPAVALPGLLLLVGTVSYGVATTQGLVSVVAVLATLAPVVTVGLAVVVLGERLARRQQLGVVTALVGVVLLAAG